MNYISVLSTLAVFICISDLAVRLTEARKCYICGEGADSPFKTLPTHHGQSSVPIVEGTCEGFRPEEKYAFDCPPTYTSCLTEVDGDIEKRTCGENLAINDCKSANNIDYCYCSEDLCNRLPRVQIRQSIESALMPSHHRNRLGGIHHRTPASSSDDEDMLESSGMDGGERGELHRSSQHHDHHEGVNVAAAPTQRDITTQITITLKPVATGATESRSRDSHGGDDLPDDSIAMETDRIVESNTIANSTSSVGPVASAPLLHFSCMVFLASLGCCLIHSRY